MTDLLTLAAARHAMGMLPSDEVPSLAAQLLASGRDTPTLRVLAGEHGAPWSDLEPTFRQTLREAGIPEMTEREAGFVIAKDYATRILSGEIAPGEGAQAIADICSSLDYPDELTGFVAAASERDDFITCHSLDPAHYDRLLGNVDADILRMARDLSVAA